jgi:CRISPR/Cas system-associated exonuclease Cas4 (RecB family)
VAKRLMEKIVPVKEVSKEETKIDTKAIIKKIHDGYEHKKGMTFKKRVGFTPSGLTYGAGHCPRFWYLWFEGNEAENSNDWYSVANMDSGTDRHTRIEQAMEDAGILVHKELSIKNEDPIISAKTDAIINWDGMEILTEIKTSNEESFHRTTKPRNYNIEQLLIYMKILKKSFAFLIYENKNTHELKFFPVNLNQKYKDFINYFFDWMRRVQKAFDDKQLPENPYRNKFENKICKSCDFFKVCQTKPVGDIKIEARKELE